MKRRQIWEEVKFQNEMHDTTVKCNFQIMSLVTIILTSTFWRVIYHYGRFTTLSYFLEMVMIF